MAPGLFVRLLAFWIVCVTVLVKNTTLCTFKAAISCDSSAYTMHPLLFITEYKWYMIIKPSYTNICILVQKVIIRNINYTSDRMRPRVTSMHYLCCRSFLSVCSFTNDIFAVRIFIEAQYARLLNLNRCRGAIGVLLIVFTTLNSRSKHVPRNWSVCACVCVHVCVCTCVCVCVCVCDEE